MLWLQTEKPETTGTIKLGGSLTRRVEQDSSITDQTPHLVNIGKMVEVIKQSFIFFFSNKNFFNFIRRWRIQLKKIKIKIFFWV
jgi:capping protein beta